MKNEIKLFKNDQFGEVRVIESNGEPLFCLSDVCKVVNLVNPTEVKRRLDKEDVQLIDLHALNSTEGIVGNAITNFITESGFYDVILQSSSPRVKPFRKWVTSEVLPSIRKTGGYMVARDDESPEEIMARALLVAQETLKRREERLKQLETENERQRTTIEEKTRENHNMMGKLIEQAPDVKYVKSTLNAPTTYTTTQIAKELGMRSAVTLHQKLKDMKVMFSQSGSWMLTAPYCDKGYTKTRTSTGENNSGGTWSKTITVWTEKGRKFLHEPLNVELKDEPAQVC